MSIEPGTLYVVATPIGNLGDLATRAREILGGVQRVAAEDTRHTRTLLQQFGIAAILVSLHEHNEEAACGELVERLAAGESVALVSDAGTPLLSDPGYRLVRRAREHGIAVRPVPGPSAITAALSVAGLPTDRFAFEGFLPPKSAARRRRLEALAAHTGTLVFFEAPHRILATLEDIRLVLGEERELVIARELTKRFETVLAGTAGAVHERVAADPDQQRGEIVLLVHGAPPRPATAGLEPEVARVVETLAAELPLKQAAALAAAITGEKKNRLYRHALEAARPPHG